MTQKCSAATVLCELLIEKNHYGVSPIYLTYLLNFKLYHFYYPNSKYVFNISRFWGNKGGLNKRTWCYTFRTSSEKIKNPSGLFNFAWSILVGR